MAGLFSYNASAAGPIWCKTDSTITVRLALDSAGQPLTKSQAIISPKNLLLASSEYRVFVRGEPVGGGTGGAMNTSGIQMGNDYTQNFPAAPPDPKYPGISPNICAIDRVEIYVQPKLSN